MTDPIRAALDKARAVYCHADGECFCATPDDCPMKLHSDVLAKIIAAFLRALSPDVTFQFRSGEHRTALDAFADAVLAAAKEERE
jgi:hypothetical protein